MCPKVNSARVNYQWWIRQGVDLSPSCGCGYYLFEWSELNGCRNKNCRADSRFVPSEWETQLHSNAVSHWLGANLESAVNCVVPDVWAGVIQNGRLMACWPEWVIVRWCGQCFKRKVVSSGNQFVNATWLWLSSVDTWKSWWIQHWTISSTIFRQDKTKSFSLHVNKFTWDINKWIKIQHKVKISRSGLNIFWVISILKMHYNDKSWERYLFHNFIPHTYNVPIRYPAKDHPARLSAVLWPRYELWPHHK